jgi:hypothetical protein
MEEHVPPIAFEPTHWAETRVSPALLGQLGEAVASGATRGLQAPGLPPQAASALAALEQLGLQLQELARVAGGRARLAPEQVDLGLAVLQARAEWQHALQEHGASLDGPATRLMVSTSAGVLKQLLDLALAHLLTLGAALKAEVGRFGVPELPAVRLVVERAGHEVFDTRPEQLDELNWSLLTLLAQASGVTLERHVEVRHVRLTLGFTPSDAPAFEGLGAPDMLATTPMPEGVRALLLEPHEPTRVHATRLLGAAGVHVTAAGTVERARSALAGHWPDCVITGLGEHDPAAALLLTEIRSHRPGLRVLELADEAHAFATSLPGSGAPVRLSRADLDRTLVTALAQELTRPQR